jgi:hypothetical protein
MESDKEEKLYRGAENALFKSSPIDEYHLPQMNSKKFFLGLDESLEFGDII